MEAQDSETVEPQTRRSSALHDLGQESQGTKSNRTVIGDWRTETFKTVGYIIVFSAYAWTLARSRSEFFKRPLPFVSRSLVHIWSPGYLARSQSEFEGCFHGWGFWLRVLTQLVLLLLFFGDLIHCKLFRLSSINEMPRKATRQHKLLQSRPFTFSRFACSVAQSAPAHKVKRQIHDCKVYRKSSSKSAGNGLLDHALPDISRQSQSSNEEVFDGVIQADFACFDPKPADFHGVKVLLQTFLDDKQWDLSGFVDLILGQTTVGTVVKIEEDDDDGLYSDVTTLNLGRYKDHKCILELKEFLLKVCQEKDLLPPLYDALFDEVSWATEDEPMEELQNSFCFKFYLLISRINKRRNAEQNEGPSSNNNEAVIYIKPEDEIFHQLSSWSFSFPLRTQQFPTHEEFRSGVLHQA
ncbi:hypothetical protein F0562_001215 [Nyssa sinensis]|uniref:Protein BCCIP homolog n=1 Tax=Nyssa sinensis TaxID=561372 RepID=A0A5J5C789_9ASTE|nr:hypothetical protein F0562_001215 [Nyssa sinensis]